jgi:hypothetical protein
MGDYRGDVEMETIKISKTPSLAKIQEIKELIAQVSQPLAFEKEMPNIIENYNNRIMSPEDQKKYLRWEEKKNILQLLKLTLIDCQMISTEIIRLREQIASLRDAIISLDENEDNIDEREYHIQINLINDFIMRTSERLTLNKNQLELSIGMFDRLKVDAATLSLLRPPTLVKGGTKRTRNKRRGKKTKKRRKPKKSNKRRKTRRR